MSIKEKALAKMLVEMNKDHNDMEDEIHNWLCGQDDVILISGILMNNKSIKEAAEYCVSKAKEKAQNGTAMIADDTVFNWVAHYFKTNDLKFDKVVGQTNSVVTKKTKTKEKIKPKQKKEPLFDGEQLNLLDFI